MSFRVCAMLQRSFVCWKFETSPSSFDPGTFLKGTTGSRLRVDKVNFRLQKLVRAFNLLAFLCEAPGEQTAKDETGESH